MSTWPRLTVLKLVTLWGSYSLVDGIVALTSALSSKPGTPRA